MNFKGTYTAMITPFQNGEVDLEGLKANIAFQINNGIDGIVLMGTTGECATLLPSEQEAIIKTASHQSVPVIIGTGANSTEVAINKTQLAEKLGADAALIITPYYNKPTQEGIFQHFQAIANAVSLPIIVYNNPARTCVNIEEKTLERIVKLPNIKAIKEASGNLKQVKSFSSLLPVLCGNDEQTLDMIQMGAKGVISVISNLIPSKFSQFVKLALNGKLQEALSVQNSFEPLLRALSLETNPIPIKTAMRLCGFPSGNFRLPLCDLSEENLKNLKETITYMDF